MFQARTRFIIYQPKNTNEQLACLGENGQIWVSYALIKWTE